MDTPRSNLGDATYLGRPPPDFDMTQEPSFHSPSKDNNLVQQLRNGRAANLRTPRGSRAPFGDRRNLPAGIGGSEFTPMLKSATRNSARRRGKENTNGLTTPALGKIDEDMDMTNVPVESSLYGPSRNLSYVATTPMPEVDASSTASTPLVQPTRRGGDKGPLQDGNQLSLREQENVIDKIEKENFGLKLKIHFLEEALRKTGPGFSEAALKENTELKVDKVTMQRELSKYKKHLASAEKDLETYQQQILDVQEKAKKKYADQSQKAENDALRHRLEEREAEISQLQQQLQQQSQDDDVVEQLRNEVADLEADLRTKDREVNEGEEELDELRTKLEELENSSHRELEEKEAEIGRLQRQLQQQSGEDGELNDLRDKTAQLEADLLAKDHEINESEEEMDELRRKLEDLENSSRRRLKDKEAEVHSLQQRLQQASRGDNEVEQLHKEIAVLEADLRAKDHEANEHAKEVGGLRTTIETLQQQLRRQAQGNDIVEELRGELADLEADLRAKDHEANEHKKEIVGLKTSLENLQRQLQRQTQGNNLVEELRSEIADLEADIREKDHEINEREDDASEARQMIQKLESNIQNLERQTTQKDRELKAQAEQFLQQREAWEHERGALSSKLETVQNNLATCTDEKMLLQLRHDALGAEKASLQRDITRLQKQIAQLEDHNEKGRAEKRDLEAQRDRLEDRATGLQRTVDRLRDAEGALSGKETQLQAALNSEAERHKNEETALSRQIDDLRHELDTKQSTLLSLRNEVSSLQNDLRQSQADRQAQSEKVEALEDKVEALQTMLDEESGDANQQLKQVDELRHELETKQATLLSLRNEISGLRDDLSRSEVDREAQSEKIEALEDEVEVLQATLDEESEDASQRLKQADELNQDLRRQLREQAQRTDRLGQLEGADKVAEALRQQLEQTKQDLQEAEQECEDADRVAEMLRQQLEETKQSLHDAEQECQELKEKLDGASRQESRGITQANQATEDLKRQLLRAQKESKKAELSCENLRIQLDAAREELDYANPLCKELRQKLDRARRERAEYQAAAEKLQYDCDRLKKGAQEALAWIQAKNAEKPSSVAPGPIKQAAMATFRYGDVVMDVVDQKDHEAVIRAADSAQRRHKKEIRGMDLYIMWMQARWERESKLRNDGASAKRFLQLQLEIADACNKAQLRRINGILQNLGLKSSAELIVERRKDRKPLNKLKVFITLIRAVARMRVDARKWGEHEKTRLRLSAALEEQKQQQVLC
ncbi:hypothetical protein FHL15_008500 [Xylaria flabelliformis]|uniref:Centrosomin N-terminal motif 1 domain-containing protein n=1 Tax=Xylaria flabelliformis TaxID=2512241 RepID=A0A553HRE2_9PEZI|nr:hypothetical protein FHL15_008500 [Xylaria flabelliformis]